MTNSKQVRPHKWQSRQMLQRIAYQLLYMCTDAWMKSARGIVMAECDKRRPVQLDTSGDWHCCHRTRCTIVNLREYVCIGGRHVVPQNTCPRHDGNVLHVTDVYACKATGRYHVCDQNTCIAENGKCSISGRCCVQRLRAPMLVPVSNKRCRRRPCSVHTNEQAACILIYNLLFSRRRVHSEVQRATASLEVARRQGQRYVKNQARAGGRLRYQALVDLYVERRQRLRYTGYLIVCDTEEVQREVCMHYARIAIRLWTCLLHALPIRSVFDATCAAILYAMRKGVAFDGLFAIPPDRFLGYALPDAHAIKDVDISRKSFTQSKNALYEAIQTCVTTGTTSVEQFAFKFKEQCPPLVLVTHFNNV